MFNKTHFLRKNILLYLLAFISGGALMGVELIGAKMMAPFYGNTIYVWSGVIGATLGGLAVGYFFGGFLSLRFSGTHLLYIIVFIMSILTGILPALSKTIMNYSLVMDPKVGIPISLAVYLLPLMICFGSISPNIIHNLVKKTDTVGKTAGTVYAVSTLGGIITVFFFGFYMIPFRGLKESSFVISAALLLISMEYVISLMIKNRLVQSGK